MSTNSRTFLEALIAHNNKQPDAVEILIDAMTLQDLFDTGVALIAAVASRTGRNSDIGDRVHFAAARMQDFRLHTTALKLNGSFCTQIESHLRLSAALSAAEFGIGLVQVKMKQVSTPTLVVSLFLATNLIAQDFGDNSDVNLTYAAMIEELSEDIAS